MKYRVRYDISFDNEVDARALMQYGKLVLDSPGVSQPENEDTSSCELELCRHDEGLQCILIERAINAEPT